MMKGCLLLLWLLLPVGAGWAQSCATPNPPGGHTFTAIDVATGQQVEAFCVGRGVRFAPHPSRGLASDIALSYGVLPGVGTTFVNSTPTTCTPPSLSIPLAPYIYTPQPAEVGLVTVSELANERIPKYYIRTFPVYARPAPTFTVAPCPNGQVLVTVTDATYDIYNVVVGTGLTERVLRGQPKVLPVPGGATTVTVTGQYALPGLCTNSNTLPIPALAAPQTPLLSSLTLDGPLPAGPAIFAVGQLLAGYRYTLQVTDASAPSGFRDLSDVLPGATSVQVPAPVAGCYRLFRTDVCGGSPAASDTVCTLGLTGRSAQNRNQLLLADAGPDSTYTVTRDGRPLPTFTRVPGGLEDADVQCGTAYTYRVTAPQPGGGLAVSNEVTITTQSTLPPPAPRLLASFNLNNVVVLTPLLATPLLPGSTLRYRRAVGGQAPAGFGAVAATARSQRDSTTLAELRAAPPCYSASLIDVCGNASPESPATCPALLTAAPADPEGTTAALTWTAFTGPDPAAPATYALERLAPDGTVLSTMPVSGTAYLDLLPPTDRQVLRYRLRISGAGLLPGTVSYSNVATLTRRLSLAIPTAFTPNGDGLNDVLEVKGRYLENYTFVVVDRNGQEVFRSTQRREVWDGTIRGHAPVPGAYVWRFQQATPEGPPFVATGSITILP